MRAWNDIQSTIVFFKCKRQKLRANHEYLLAPRFYFLLLKHENLVKTFSSEPIFHICMRSAWFIFSRVKVNGNENYENNFQPFWHFWLNWVCIIIICAYCNYSVLIRDKMANLVFFFGQRYFGCILIEIYTQSKDNKWAKWKRNDFRAFFEDLTGYCLLQTCWWKKLSKQLKKKIEFCLISIKCHRILMYHTHFPKFYVRNPSFRRCVFHFSTLACSH